MQTGCFFFFFSLVKRKYERRSCHRKTTDVFTVGQMIWEKIPMFLLEYILGPCNLRYKLEFDHKLNVIRQYEPGSLLCIDI